MTSNDKRACLMVLEGKQFSLGGLVELDVASRADEIVSTSITATQEHSLGTQLEELQQSWAKCDFDVVAHQREGPGKDAYKLASLEVVQALLDDSMQTASLIAGSRYAKRL